MGIKREVRAEEGEKIKTRVSIKEAEASVKASEVVSGKVSVEETNIEEIEEEAKKGEIREKIRKARERGKVVPLREELIRYIEEEAEEKGIDVRIVYAIMEHESKFQANVVSETDDYGLMQINGCHRGKYREVTGKEDMVDDWECG